MCCKTFRNITELKLLSPRRNIHRLTIVNAVANKAIHEVMHPSFNIASQNTNYYYRKVKNEDNKFCETCLVLQQIVVRWCTFSAKTLPM
jgi:hypothetical protein